jgi:amino acid transporter
VSFLVAGLIALAAGYSYVKLAGHYGEGGGAFTFLREINAEGFAGSLSWVLIIGYVLTNAVYAFTFGRYLGHVVGLGPWFPRAAAVGIMAIFIGLNLKGVGEAGGVEVFLVWFKLAVLVALAAWGLSRWDLPMLSQGMPDAGLAAAIFGASAVFMAYEGFQLLTYDYEDISQPKRTLPRAVLSAIVLVTILYVGITLGTAMLIGADQVAVHGEVALAVAGQELAGFAGLVVVTVAAAFSTGSAINSTLFATARLASEVAEDGELPAVVDHRNRAGVPDRAVFGLGLLAAILAVLGGLSSLVEAASLAFLFTFTVVCGLAFRSRIGVRFVTCPGALAGAAATIGLVVRLAQTEPRSLALLGMLVLLSVFGRPLLLRTFKTETKRR